MSAIVIFIIILVVLYVSVFVSNRRYGVLGLALVSGSVVSSLWAEDLTLLVQDFGVNVVSPPLSAVIAVFLILLPSVVLLMTTAKCKSAAQRIVGSFLFAVLAMALLLEPLGRALILEGPSKQLFDVATMYQNYIVTIGIVFAIVDLLLTRSSHKHKDAKH